jgi:hypothetical protein
MENVVLEEFSVFTLNCEENIFGGIKISGFFRFCSGSHVVVGRRGGTCVTLLCVWRNFENSLVNLIGVT